MAARAGVEPGVARLKDGSPAARRPGPNEGSPAVAGILGIKKLCAPQEGVPPTGVEPTFPR